METTERESRISPLRRAAIILAALGEETAAEICSRLPASQVLALGDELAALPEMSPAEINRVLAEFIKRVHVARLMGGPAFARRILASTLGEAGLARHSEVGDLGLTVLSRLDDLEPALLWRLLREEKPQTIAALLSHLSPATAAALLSNFDERRAAEITYRAARLAPAAPGAMQALAKALEMELHAAHARAGEGREVSVQFVVNLINSMAPDRSKRMLAALSEMDAEFGANVAERVFTFEDLARMNDRDLQVVLRAVDVSVLALALKGTPLELRERIRQNLSQRAQERLQEESDLLGPVPVSQVQEAQRQVCQVARQLSEAGEIGLGTAAEEYVE